MGNPQGRKIAVRAPLEKVESPSLKGVLVITSTPAVQALVSEVVIVGPHGQTCESLVTGLMVGSRRVAGYWSESR